MKVRVFVVDDDPELRELYREVLADEGYEVVCFESGEAMLKTVASGEVDFVLTDLKLPGMDGIEIVRLLGQRCPNVPVVVITGHASLDTAVKAMRLGAYDYLTKPCLREELALRVKSVLQRKRLENKVREAEKLAAAIETSMLIEAPVRDAMSDAYELLCERGERYSDKSLLMLADSLREGRERIARILSAFNSIRVQSSIFDEELQETSAEEN